MGDMMRWIIGVLCMVAWCRADDVGHVIGELGHKKFAVREAAQQQLVERGSQDTDAILQRTVREYAATKDPEIRERLRVVMLTLVDQHLFRRPRAFLGIAMGMGLRFVGEGLQVPTVSQIQVMNLIPDTAAVKAGLQIGDLIVGVDGKALAKEATSQAFSEYIRTKAPGEKIQLSLIRGEAKLEMEVELGGLTEAQQAELFTPERRDAFFKDWLGEQLQKMSPARPEFDKAPASR